MADQKGPTQAKWQERAWSFYDQIGPIQFAYNQSADAASRVRLFVAVQPPDGFDEPIPIQDAVDDAVPGVTQSLADASTMLFDRIRSAEGSRREIQREAVLNLKVPGEFVLLGEEVGVGQEEWTVVNIAALEWRQTTAEYGVWVLKSSPSDRKGRELDPATTNLVRIWRRHGAWPQVATSNVRAILDDCEELLRLKAGNRAIATSRIVNTGITYISNDLDLAIGAAGDRPTGFTDDATAEDPFLNDWGEMWMQGVRTPDSAAAVVPGVVRGDGGIGSADGEKIKHISFERPLTEDALRRLQECTLAIARGLDAPPEYVLGLGDTTTYATGRQISRNSYIDHLDPTVLLYADGMAAGHIRPGLAEMGFTAEQVNMVMVWRDPASLFFDPDRPKLAIEVAKLGAISDGALRDATGFGDDDAPEPGEEPPAPMLPAADEGTPETNPNAEGAAIDTTSRLVITASADPLERIAIRLGRIDRSLFDRLLALGDKALVNALNVAGAKLRSQASARTSPYRDLVKRGMAAHEVAAALGPDRIVALAGDPGSLMGGAFDRWEDDFDQIVGRHQRDARNAVLADTGFDGSDAALRQDDDRSKAWVVFLAALTAVASDRLLNPTAPEPATGEFDPTLAVPGGVVRAAVAMAGGAPTSQTATGGLVDAAGQPATGMTNGPTMRDLVREALAAEFQGYLWTWGGAARPFDPHVNLDGAFFTGYDDPILFYDDWPANGGPLFPGDHDGCTCSAHTAKLVPAGEG